MTTNQDSQASTRGVHHLGLTVPDLPAARRFFLEALQIRRIEREHPALGRHLGRSVRTGTTCCYRPDRPTEWLLD